MRKALTRFPNSLRLAAALMALVVLSPAWALDPCEEQVEQAIEERRAPLSPEDFPRLAPEFSERPILKAQADAMDALVEEFIRVTGTPALDVFLLLEDGRAWSRHVSSSDASAPPESEQPLFYWASVGKTWVALVALQLVQEGKLTLDARLADWAPEFPGAAEIRIEDLLRHTSGLYSFQEDPALRARPGYKPPAELLAVARARPLLFCPGSRWAYSNTGYVLLGQIIEAVEGRPLAAVLESRIAAPLGLRHVRALGPDSPIEDLVPPAPKAPAGGTADDLRTPGAAGPIAASAADMARFWLASFSDALLTPAMRRLRFEGLRPGLGQHFGLGAMVYDLPASPNTPPDVWLGHSGGLPGAKAVVAWSTRQRAVAAVALSGDAPAEALANRLLALLEIERAPRDTEATAAETHQ
jgi:D-alanyl-D-alanine carboxypeptidase